MWQASFFTNACGTVPLAASLSPISTLTSPICYCKYLHTPHPLPTPYPTPTTRHHTLTVNRAYGCDIISYMSLHKCKYPWPQLKEHGANRSVWIQKRAQDVQWGVGTCIMYLLRSHQAFCSRIRLRVLFILYATCTMMCSSFVYILHTSVRQHLLSNLNLRPGRVPAAN